MSDKMQTTKRQRKKSRVPAEKQCGATPPKQWLRVNPRSSCHLRKGHAGKHQTTNGHRWRR